MNDVINDFLEFSRFKLCIFAPILAMSGYFFSNGLFAISSDALFLSLSSFFLCTAVYSYNNMTDKDEDLINKKKINTFVSNKKGYVFVAGFILEGLFFSVFLSAYSALSALVFLVTVFAYSFFRLKKYPLLKNIYTGFSVSVLFLVGAFSHAFTSEAILYYVSISVFLSIGSIISDLRDYEGDKAVGLKTIPVCVGYDKTRLVVMFSLVAYSFSILLLFKKFFILLPFALLILFAIKNDSPRLAHSFGRCSFLFLLLWLIL